MSSQKSGLCLLFPTATPPASILCLFISLEVLISTCNELIHSRFQGHCLSYGASFTAQPILCKEGQTDEQREMAILGNNSEILDLGNTDRSSQKRLSTYQSLKLGRGSRLPDPGGHSSQPWAGGGDRFVFQFI